MWSSENALDGLGEFEELYLLEDPSTLVDGNDQNLSSTFPASSFVSSATSANKISKDDKTGNLTLSRLSFPQAFTVVRKTRHIK